MLKLFKDSFSRFLALYKFVCMFVSMWFKATKSLRRKFESRVRAWKLKEEKACEYRCMVRDKVEEAKWKSLGVNEHWHWHQMKGLMMETAQDICGMTTGLHRYNETWWWNEEVAEAVREKKIKYESGREKIRKKQGWSIRRVDKMQRGLSLQQRKRNRRNVQMT